MELKTKYQYTYFVYPYLVKESKYIKYLLKLLKDKRLKLKIFQREKDFDVYKYFLPRVRDYMFHSFSFNKSKIKMLNQMNTDTVAALLAKQPCTIFEYHIENDIQGKAGYKEGIFFRIQKIEVICFNTGICFLCIKTNIEDSEEFSDILNFNYKFRDINQEFNNLNNYDNIRVQTDTFTDIKKITEFIGEITGHNVEAIKLDLDTERFLTYSYACIDQEAWNSTTGFENIENSFSKYINVLPNDNSINFEKNTAKVISKWKYAKVGITKLGISLLASTADINNYTVLPQKYETQYLYTYIFALYKKIFLKKIASEISLTNEINKRRREFIEFTKKVWIQEISADSMGTLFYQNLKEELELDELYYKVKNKYDILYKELNIEKDRNVNKFIVVALVVSLMFNIFNFIALALK